ncbi:MAG TPA: rhodanese-like domain-containing protein [Oligoflexia bacterium]|nr:rhodanese-like domain-containing protein [Oligoflexia bacterium]HMP48317.1 rhodanese-like domain-containing protein [Oligoflexia bacterium]
MENINPQELFQQMKNDPSLTVIDVRTPAEFESAHIPSAINLPLGSREFLEFINNNKGTSQTIHVTCQKGGRAKTACEELEKLGIPFKNLSGGMSAWAEENLPMIEGKKTISIERQVRISAGALVLLGVLLFYAGFKGAILLSAFVGAGLVFAGATDTCGMAMVLARMPWNQARSDKKTSCCAR